MEWETRVYRYLKAIGWELLGFEGGLVFFRDTDGVVWGSGERPLHLKMESWEREQSGHKGG